MYTCHVHPGVCFTLPVCPKHPKQVVLVRNPTDRVSAAVLAGVIGGVGGCLSTVSTWVVEVRVGVCRQVGFCGII